MPPASGGPRLTFLGTGDPLNYERGQTALALTLGAGDTALIDTASGTALLSRLRTANIGLATIRHIFITHRHFDHAGGLAPLLVALVAAPGSEVTVYAMPDTSRALHGLLELTIPGVETWLGTRLRWRELATGTPLRVDDLTVTPFAVEHGLECVGLELDHGNRKTVFSADSKPCANLTRAASDADLLIHEAYSLESGAEMAHLFGHSTARDAGDAARAAGARELILTHFRASEFVDTAALVDEAASVYGPKVRAAHDFLDVTV